MLQRDIDRVSEMFHEQGFLEARVRTRRIEDADTNTVAVEYRVERGPRTILLITGATLPAGEIEELQEAWHRNAFDQFLIEDLTGRVRRYLVTQNELASVVVGTVDHPTPDTQARAHRRHARRLSGSDGKFVSPATRASTPRRSRRR